MATKTANPFDQLRMDPSSMKRSMQWYRNQIKNLGDVTKGVNKLVVQGDARVIPGKLYLFHYDPKWKDVLPYYDTLPLVLPFAKAEGGFYGINLHYLPYGLRFKLMGGLLEMVRDITDPSSKAQVSWKILSKSSKFPGVNACVKHYLSDHVRSPFLNIPNDQWLAAAMLPIEKFEKAEKEYVFRQSRKYA